MKTSVARRLYRVIPSRLRKLPLANKFSVWVQGYLPHNWVYDETYYNEAVEGAAAASAIMIVSSIMRDAQPKSVVDVGCGTGALLEAFRTAGCKVFGLEKSEAALAFCRSRNLPVVEFDLEQDAAPVESTFE